MSALPRHIRLQAAAREMGDVMDSYSRGEDSIPQEDFKLRRYMTRWRVHAMERALFGVATRFRVPFELAYMALCYDYDQQHPEPPERWPGEHDGDDPPRPFSPTGFAA